MFFLILQVFSKKNSPFFVICVNLLLFHGFLLEFSKIKFVFLHYNWC